VIIGGAGPGSGRALSRRFAREGCRIVISDIDEEGGWALADSIRSEGGKAMFRLSDTSGLDSIRELFRVAERKFGGVDIMVHNASAPYRPDGSLLHWIDTLKVDLLGALMATEVAIEAMERRGGGSIVLFSSTSAIGHGYKPSASAAYDIAKAGVVRLATMMAPLEERLNIRVNCIAPDWIAVPEVRAFWDPLTPEQRRMVGAPQRLTSVEEIAEAVVRLSTDENLSGRVMVWWSDEEAGLIPACDPGYNRLEPYPIRVAD